MVGKILNATRPYVYVFIVIPFAAGLGVFAPISAIHAGAREDPPSTD